MTLVSMDLGGFNMEPTIRFHNEPFHYLDNKLLTEAAQEKSFIDWKNLLVEQKKLFANHYFLVTDGYKVNFIDTALLNHVKFNHEKDKNHELLNIEITENNADLSLYWIQIHGSEKNQVNLINHAQGKVALFHHNIICQKSVAFLFLHNHGQLKYYHQIDSKVSQLFHGNMQFYNYGLLEHHFFEHEQSGKTKIDKQVVLMDRARYEAFHTVFLKQGQLRDDTVEIIHQGHDSYSEINYLSLNDGKSVTQINSIIPQDIKRCETHQHIRHVLRSEQAQSFSKPQLMIDSSDVISVSHGNAIGTYDDDLLFYLQQHGIDAHKTRDIISHSLIEQNIARTPYEEGLSSYFWSPNHE
jgi:Fe-S cluster assembly scaffold protein SufB